MSVRVLLLADTHLGFDHPVAPRVRRRRRGHDFLANYLRALEPARRGEVDLVVHAGDVFDHPRVPHTLVAQAFEPLRRLADDGVPVAVVPGNHECSRIPHERFAAHPGIHVFGRPRTVRLDVRGIRVALAGFPFERRDVRLSFADRLAETGWKPGEGDVALLCVHHCFQGATVGPVGFTFRHGPDVIRSRDVPSGVAAVLTGHVHRHQVLTADLAGRPLPAPILYPGSVERTAFAEMGEAKGFLTLDVEPDAARPGGRLVGWRFHPLPARPMVVADLAGADPGLPAALTRAVASAPRDAVLRLRVRGPVPTGARALLAAEALRRLAPPEMNVEVAEVPPLISPGVRREHPSRPPRPARLRDGVRITPPARRPAASRGPSPGVSPHAAPAPPLPPHP